MALVIKRTITGYSYLFDEVADPRVKDFFMMSSPIPITICSLLYLYIVLDYGPKFMKNREPYNLKNILIVFNAAQVLVNSFLFYHAVKETSKMDWTCALVSEGTTPHDWFVLRMIHLYFLTKLADLLDTIFFILRKKGNQMSFLHIYHHFGMSVISWIGVKFLPGGHSIFLGLFNTFVHAVMYFYYLVTIFKPEYKKYIWWKKYITQLQLIQFILFVIIYGQLLFRPSCTYPKLVSWFITPQNLFMMLLFGDFYYHAYIKTPEKKLTADIKQN